MNVSFWMPLGCWFWRIVWQYVHFGGSQTFKHFPRKSSVVHPSPFCDRGNVPGHNAKGAGRLRSQHPCVLCATCCLWWNRIAMPKNISYLLFLFLCYFCFTMLFTLGCKNIWNSLCWCNLEPFAGVPGTVKGVGGVIEAMQKKCGKDGVIHSYKCWVSWWVQQRTLFHLCVASKRIWQQGHLIDLHFGGGVVMHSQVRHD